jgi:hypothetical protein
MPSRLYWSPSFNSRSLKGGNHHEDPTLLFSLTSSRIDSIRTLQYLVIRVYFCSSSMSRAVSIFVAGRESDIPMSRESFWRLLPFDVSRALAIGLL